MRRRDTIDEAVRAYNEAQLEADNKMTRDVTFCIDRGGTFTTSTANTQSQERRRRWLLNFYRKTRRIINPHPEGIRRALEIITKENISREVKTRTARLNRYDGDDGWDERVAGKERSESCRRRHARIQRFAHSWEPSETGILTWRRPASLV